MHLCPKNLNNALKNYQIIRNNLDVCKKNLLFSIFKPTKNIYIDFSTTSFNTILYNRVRAKRPTCHTNSIKNKNDIS